MARPRLTSERREAILRSHRDLLAQVRGIETAADPGLLPGLLEQLGDALERHFEHEEEEGGLYDVLRGHARGREACGFLLDEHRDLLAETRRLVDGTPRARNTLRAAALELVDRLRGHEKREHRLLMDVLSQNSSPPG